MAAPFCQRHPQSPASQREMNMSKVTDVRNARRKKERTSAASIRNDGFQPCSPDMTICGDCADNRSKNRCPRLKEWLAKRQER